VRVKARIVAEDEREAGRRRVLNLGHTIGHALEQVLGYGRLRHGEAVAIGLVGALEWAAAQDLGPTDLPARIRELLTRLGLPVAAPATRPGDVVEALMRDKKLQLDTVAWVYLKSVAAPAVAQASRAALHAWVNCLEDRGVLAAVEEHR
jgi:3-dehydroquinate synthase